MGFYQKYRIGLGLVLVLWLKPFLACAAVSEEEDNRFKVLWATGSVAAYHVERDETTKLRTAEWIDDGDNVSTGAKSEALLRLPGKAYVFLGPHTKIHISRLRSSEKGLQVRLNLLNGDLWCELDHAPKNMIFEASMQNLICRCHGTLFEAIRQKDATRIISFEGSVVTISHARVKMAQSGEVIQYIQDKFRYKHRLKNSDENRLAQWKSHFADILLKTHAKNPRKP